MSPWSRLLTISVAVACLAACLSASAAQAAAPAWEPLAASGPTNLPPRQSEIQRVAVDAEGGTFTLSFGAQTTSAIPFDADALEVGAKLNALSTIGGAGGSVTVKGGPGGPKGSTNPYFVTFGGSLAEADLAGLGADASALTGAESHHTTTVTTALDGGPGTGAIAIYAQNVGGLASSGTTTVTFTLPTGVTTNGDPVSDFGGSWTCTPPGAGQSGMTCTSTAVAQPGFTLPPFRVPVISGPDAASGIVHITVSGGGTAGTAEYDMPLTVSAAPAQPGLQSFVAAAYDENGLADNRAGAHPYSASAGILVTTKRAQSGQIVPVGEFRDIVAQIPPGFIGDPIATEQCPEFLEHNECSHQSIVATAQIPLGFGSAGEKSSVNNIEAPFGSPAKLRFLTGAKQVIINVISGIRSDEDYGIEFGSFNTPQVIPISGSFFTFWGTPAAESHDAQRCKVFENTGNPLECGPGGEDVAFLTSAVDCAEEALRTPEARISINTWQQPLLNFLYSTPIKPVVGCEELEFKADFTFQPSVSAADSPGAFEAKLTLPTGGLTDPKGKVTPEQKKVFVDLPNGVALNPSAADGLDACSEAQMGFKGANFPRPNKIRFDKSHPQCPDASKIGTVEVKTPLLAEPLNGAMYLAAQGNANPFGSLFAVYLVIDSPERGIIVKLPGEVQPDPNTGQLRTVFDDLPQLPIGSLKLSFKGGSRSPFATPPVCGKYTTRTLNTPWSAPESGPDYPTEDSFQIDKGPDGGACVDSLAQRPFDIGFSAGSRDPVAGAKSPFTMRITRPDGSQELERLNISPPPGFVASLKGIPYCSEAQIDAARSKDGRDEQGNSSCPSASQIGTTDSGAGAGSTPYYAPGKLYLAGPYKGETLSVLSVTPAVAGPFDLGNVVIRAALKLDPRTARITAISDPIPQVIEGVPLRARDIRINLDRPNWAQNPTNCEAMSVDATVFGSNGAVSHPSNRFQVGGCENLGFKPKLEIHLKGGTKRGDHPALRAVLSTRDGDANIAAAAVTLPPSAFLDQAHIRTVCTRVQFAANACPSGAIYGYGEAVTELLDDPIKGNVYLRSSDNKLPDLVAALKGVANIEAVGRIDSVKGGIRNTFDIIPDAPFDTFTLKMQGGKKGLVVNSQNLCAKAHRATVRLTAQNGKRYNFRPKVIADNCKKAKKGKRHKRPAKRSRR